MQWRREARLLGYRITTAGNLDLRAVSGKRLCQWSGESMRLVTSGLPGVTSKKTLNRFLQLYSLRVVSQLAVLAKVVAALGEQCGLLIDDFDHATELPQVW